MTKRYKSSANSKWFRFRDHARKPHLQHPSPITLGTLEEDTTGTAVRQVFRSLQKDNMPRGVKSKYQMDC